MKRYLLFAGDSYYANGGWYDFRSSFDTLTEAQGIAEIASVLYDGEPDWWHIIDITTGEVVDSHDGDYSGRR